MGAFLDKPKTDKCTESGEGSGLRYVVCSQQGWRVEMEDAHCAALSMHERVPDWSFFGVFDGHAGSESSAYCSAHLMREVVAELQNHAGGLEECVLAQRKQIESNDLYEKDEPVSEQCDNQHDQQGEPVQVPVPCDVAGGLEWLRPGVTADAELCRDVGAAVQRAFFSTDEHMRADEAVLLGRSGTTAVCALVTPRHVFLANCGDSRAVLYSGGAVARATLDHKPSCPDERERIVAAGGSVLMARVNGSLGVSRALGDFVYKEVPGLEPRKQLVSPEPEIFSWPRDPPRDEFLVLACDGVWDVFNSDDLCYFLQSRLRVVESLEDVAHQLLDECLYLGSKDNMSVIIVLFEAAPTVDPEAVKAEEKFREEIITAVDEYLKYCPATQFIDKGAPAPSRDDASEETSSDTLSGTDEETSSDDVTFKIDMKRLMFSLLGKCPSIPLRVGFKGQYQFVKEYAISQVKIKYERELREEAERKARRTL